jgi:hypothetical protein
MKSFSDLRRRDGVVPTIYYTNNIEASGSVIQILPITAIDWESGLQKTEEDRYTKQSGNHSFMHTASSMTLRP